MKVFLSSPEPGTKVKRLIQETDITLPPLFISQNNYMTILSSFGAVQCIKVAFYVPINCLKFFWSCLKNKLTQKQL